VAAFLLVMFVVQGYGPSPAAAAVPLPAIAVLPGADRTTLVVDLGASTGPVNRKTVPIAVDGVPQQAQLAPVMSERLAVAFVIDTSAAGGAALPAWLSAAARFILEAPAGTQAAVVADASPPTLISPPQRGPLGIVSALSGVRAGGQRRTSDALTLAKAQFPASPTGHRVVVVYTGAAHAGGESAAALSARFQQAGTILIVVGSAGDSTYWTGAARATGGFFAPAGTPVVVPALDQVATTLRGRYLVQFPTPRALPARVSVRIDAGKLVLTGDVVIPADSGRPRPASRLRLEVALAAIAGCLLVFFAAALLIRRRSARRRAARSDGSARDEPASTVVPEGAAVAGTVARGRASVPGAAVVGRAPVPGANAPGRAAAPGTGPGGPPASPP
jgi:glyoxylase-like metal-dependent hydrolase (beta-lactamase superfamily II)